MYKAQGRFKNCSEEAWLNLRNYGFPLIMSCYGGIFINNHNIYYQLISPVLLFYLFLLTADEKC